MFDEYLWIFVVSVFLAIFVAWGIGANDVVSLSGKIMNAFILPAANTARLCRQIALGRPSARKPSLWDRWSYGFFLP